MDEAPTPPVVELRDITDEQRKKLEMYLKQ